MTGNLVSSELWCQTVEPFVRIVRKAYSENTELYEWNENWKNYRQKRHPAEKAERQNRLRRPLSLEDQTGKRRKIGREARTLNEAKYKLRELVKKHVLRIESCCYRTGISWFEAKTSIIRAAVRAYLANPKYLLTPTA